MVAAGGGRGIALHCGEAPASAACGQANACKFASLPGKPAQVPVAGATPPFAIATSAAATVPVGGRARLESARRTTLTLRAGPTHRPPHPEESRVNRRRPAANPLRPRRASTWALAVACSLALHSQAFAQQAAPSAQDQASAPKQLDTIIVTGSRIKRVDAETALPVEVVYQEDIAKRGVTTAAELVKTLTANTAPVSDGQSITDGTSGQRGLNAANLRGIGASSTLVLLNGRRLANFAAPGDNAAVDLNSIPAGAIERVEVLKDGASAVYGTDAIGGVINFITRSDYQGIDLSLSAADTQHGGADKQTLTISGGLGDIEVDRYNLFAVFDAQGLGALRSIQRRFIQDRPLASTLPALMSSNTFPANFDISSAQRNALIAAGVLPPGTTRTRLNATAPGCNPPATVYAAEGPGGPLACSYDYMRDTEIYPEATKLGFLGRGTFALNDDHRAFIEVTLSENATNYRLSPNPIRIRNLPVSVLPQPYRDVLANAGFITFSGIRYRMEEAGNRTHEVSSDGERVVLGLEGTWSGWDYDTAFMYSNNKAVDRYVDGYVLYDQFDAGVRSGTINPFGPSSQAGQDLIDRITIDDEARKSSGTTKSWDFGLSRSLRELEGGSLGLAIGGEYRTEAQRFTPSALLLSNNIAGDRDSSGSTAGIEATYDTREVAGAYMELLAPFTKTFEMQFALRWDHYSGGVGSTVNPKLGLTWKPSSSVLLRASAGTGFRAPSLNDLYRPTTFGVTSSLITDPACVDIEGSIDLCTDQWPVERRSNPNLQPEESTQYSAGIVFSPSSRYDISLDYWNIRKTNVISTLGEQVIIENPDAYDGIYIERDADGFIENVILQKENQGELRTSGIDINGSLRFGEYGWGRIGLDVSGTYVLEYKRQFGPLEPFRSNLGLFLNDQVIQRWRHRVAINWDRDNLGLTLSNNYLSGYTDQNTTYDPVTDSPLPDREVEAYSLWDLTGSWQATDRLKVRAGVLNVLDTDPPFSNQAYYFLAGYDPSYTDPRGRSFFIGIDYRFR
jgi:iron complex outermembrane receptor protein